MQAWCSVRFRIFDLFVFYAEHNDLRSVEAPMLFDKEKREGACCCVFPMKIGRDLTLQG